MSHPTLDEVERETLGKLERSIAVAKGKVQSADKLFPTSLCMLDCRNMDSIMEAILSTLQNELIIHEIAYFYEKEKFTKARLALAVSTPGVTPSSKPKKTKETKVPEENVRRRPTTWELKSSIEVTEGVLERAVAQTVTKCKTNCKNLVNMKLAQLAAIKSELATYKLAYKYENDKLANKDAVSLSDVPQSTIEKKEDVPKKKEKEEEKKEEKKEGKKEDVPKEKEKNLQSTHETQTETKSYKDCANQTMPLHYTQPFQVGRLKFRLTYNRIWQKKFEKSIKELLRGSIKLILRAFAKYKPDTTKDDRLMQDYTEHKIEVGDELSRLKSKLELIDLELHESVAIRELEGASNKSKEDIVIIQKEIEELRHETIELQLNAITDIANIKKSTAETQASLAVLRQSYFELKHGLHNITLDNAKTTLLILKTALEAEAKVKEQFEKLPSFVTPEKLSEALQTEREYHVLRSEEKHVTLDVDVTKLESYEIMAMVSRIAKFDSTLPMLDAQAKDVNLILGHQTAVLTEAKSLIKELESITKSTLKDFVQLRREEEDKRRIEVEDERIKTKQSNKKTRLSVARKSLERKEEQEGKERKENLIKSELDHSVPKVVSFVKEWNSLKQGDIFLFKGIELTVDETFNPSLRIAHLGQESDKWEAQKHANTSWYVKGNTSLIR